MARILALERRTDVEKIAFAPKIVTYYEVLFKTETGDTVDAMKELKRFFVERNLKYKSFSIRGKDSEADFPKHL